MESLRQGILLHLLYFWCICGVWNSQ